MEYDNIILEYIKVFTTTPVILFIVILIFRKRISDLLQRVTKAQLGSIQISTSIDEQSSAIAIIDKIKKEDPELFQKAIDSVETNQDEFKSYVESVSDLVRNVQFFLLKRGYAIEHTDGFMGPATRSAIRDFQRDNALLPDARLSPETLQRIAELQKRSPNK